MPLSRAERGSFQPRTLGSVLGHTRGHGPQRFGRMNVHQGCVGTTRTEIWRCECSGGPLSWTRAAGLSHSILAGPCAEAGSREIWSRECCQGRWARASPRVELRERVLGFSAVWPSGCASVSSESGRMASGVWPCGLWTLAAWRGLNLHARLGLRTLQGRMVCNLPGACPTPVPDPHWCPVCPHPAGLRLPFWRAFTVLSFQWRRRAKSHGG